LNTTALDHQLSIWVIYFSDIIFEKGTVIEHDLELSLFS